jgi:hypothetical protein
MFRIKPLTRGRSLPGLAALLELFQTVMALVSPEADVNVRRQMR